MSIRTGPLAHGQQQPKKSNVLSRNAWLVALLVPFGWGSWIGFLYAGARVRRNAWIAAGVVYLLIAAAGLTLLAISRRDGDMYVGFGTIISLIGWGAAIVHALVIRKEFGRRLELRLRVEDGQLDREIARDLVEAEPHTAKELGIGRPDLLEASPGGVVDVNHASAGVLAMLPGIDPRVARQIVGTREAMGPFSSVAELGMVLDLPADTVEQLRPLVVFLR